MDDVSPPPIASIDEEWLTIHAAARRLGVTPTAIRNRIKRGTLQTRPNGNFGRLVRVPLRLVRVPLTVPGTVPLTPEEPVTETVPPTVPLTVTLTVMADHVATLKTALAKAEGELETLRPERERLAAEAATVPVLREALSELKAEREHWQLLATDLMQRRRRWWPWRRAG
jgi:hypothetical protein